MLKKRVLIITLLLIQCQHNHIVSMQISAKTLTQEPYAIDTCAQGRVDFFKLCAQQQRTNIITDCSLLFGKKYPHEHTVEILHNTWNRKSQTTILLSKLFNFLSYNINRNIFDPVSTFFGSNNVTKFTIPWNPFRVFLPHKRNYRNVDRTCQMHDSRFN